MQNLAVGDIVLFFSDHPVHLRQQRVTGCPWSNVALLLSHADGVPVLLEASRLSDCRDLRVGFRIKGVQFSSLIERMASCNGKFAARRLVPPLTRREVSQLQAFADRVHGFPFNESPWIAARAFGRRNSPSDGRSFFCSELIAHAYQQIGVLRSPPEGLSSNNFVPADFSSAYSDAYLPLLEGRALEPERALSRGAADY
jgi:hypothetical protein